MAYDPIDIDPRDLEKTLADTIEAAVADNSAFVLLIGRPGTAGAGRVTILCNCPPDIALALTEGVALELRGNMETLQ